ncbi:MAG: RidA family protein [Chelatococcus sp.]|uniref:RidA family protein n=1 Tax=unclassified Chelatococcus TaxID=2638111 RepID=UPI001BCD036B|nr:MULTISPECIES: RidA family protein [unclassified Chelatococcus]CAH1658426.1 putative RutC family protein HD_0322 [Hyphomicrobiales bacterium]MBS7740800.1 RidA family protein [Chelatococcus sp. HY11]MBX3538505.1 RidA family protein [Chelatococcus sp.]MBX3545966.1 RidA family protein [Chelatococcus sp.]MCO5079592.1 RidA family protein [Chelatococcus sp.]
MHDIRRIGDNVRMRDCVIHNGTVYFRGLTARGGPPDAAGQARVVLDQLDGLLAKAGTTRDRLLAVTIWLTDMADFDVVNAVYDGWVVPGAQPVRACVQSQLAAPELKIEVQATAAL